jgi:phosphatidylglycerol:prolipoprotein diacylglycerol transferase
VHPILTVVHLGSHPIPIGSYGVLLCLALGVVAFGALRCARNAELDAGACIAALGATAAGAFAGAWLLHALVQCLRSGSLGAGLAQPGLAVFGALLGGAATLLWAGRRLALPVLELADRAVPWLLAGHALGRLGCLLGGCCFGRPWDGPFAVHYRNPLAPAAVSSLGRHPVPLYEAALLLALAAVLGLRPLRDAGSGRRLLDYFASYSLLRLWLECLRGDAVRGLWFGGVVSTAQLLALLVLLACACLHLRVAGARLARA